MKKLYSLGRALWLVVILLSLQTMVNAQGREAVSLKSAVYSQNFDTLGVSTTWNDASKAATMTPTLRGWYTLNEGVVPAAMVVRNSSQNAARVGSMALVNYGNEPSNENDRSLGFATRAQSNPTGYYGVRLQNNTGNEINELTIAFDVKTFYEGPQTNGITLSYKVGTPAAIGTSLVSGTWISPNANAEFNNIGSVNRTKAHSITFAVTIKPGEQIFIRFRDVHASGNSANDDDLALDNFKIIPSSVYFNKLSSSLTGDFTNQNSWYSKRNEAEVGGYSPESFQVGAQRYFVQHTDTLVTPMTIGGTNARMIVEKNQTLILNADLTATVDVEAGATVIVNSANAPTFGNLDPASTIIYTSAAPILATTYGNLVIDGKTTGLSKVLEKNIVVKGNLSLLNNSKLDIKAFDLTVEGMITNSDDLSFIQASGTGKVKKALVAGQDAYTIPLGTSSISPLILKLVSGTSDIFSVGAIDLVSSKYTGYSPNGIPVDKGAVSRTWFVSEGTVVPGETNNLEVTLKWTSGAQQTGFTPGKLSMGFYQNNSTWDNGVIMSASQMGELFSATRSVSASSIIPLVIFTNGAVDPGTLPVELTSFQGERSGNVVHLSWTTASEKDNDYFEVQQSEDGTTFLAAGEKVKGAGTSAVAQSYKAAITANSNSTLYYRLKQVDFDGKFEYSKVIAVKADGKASAQASLGAYPNPTPGKVYVSFTEGSGPATVTLFHSSGRAVFQQQVQLETGKPIADLTGQVPGIYYLQVQTNTGKSTIRVVKQ